MNTFHEAMRKKEFVVTADLPLQSTSTADDIETWAATVAPVVDALQIVDDREAVGHMSSLAAAVIVQRRNVDVVIHMTGRDRNRVALQADLLGAAALGITSLIITQGRKLSKKRNVRGKGVFDLSEPLLMGVAKFVSEESGLVPPPGFLIGTRVSAFVPAEDWTAERIGQRLDTGARFLQTQSCLNARVLRKYVKKLVDLRITHRAALLVEIPLLASVETAQSLAERNRSALLPLSAIKQISEATESLEAGIAQCAAMLAEVAEIPGVAGANIHYDGPAEHIVAVITRAGLSDRK